MVWSAALLLFSKQKKEKDYQLRHAMAEFIIKVYEMNVMRTCTRDQVHVLATKYNYLSLLIFTCATLFYYCESMVLLALVYPFYQTCQCPNPLNLKHDYETMKRSHWQKTSLWISESHISSDAIQSNKYPASAAIYSGSQLRSPILKWCEVKPKLLFVLLQYSYPVDSSHKNPKPNSWAEPRLLVLISSHLL